VNIDIGAELVSQFNAGSGCGYIGNTLTCVDSSASSTVDLGHTIRWAGISEVRDVNGSLISDFNALSSSSGFNYANAYVAAPIPGAVWLFGTGILGLLGLRRRGNIG
jgi:hypothetical protein